MVGGRRAGGTIRGDIGNIGNSNLTPPTVVIDPVTAHSAFSYQQTFNYGYAFVAVHETIHLAGHGTYSDRELAQAVYDLGGLSDDDKKRFEGLAANDAFANSAFWDHFLRKHCP